MAQSTSANAVKSANAYLEDARPKVDTGEAMFALKKGVNLLVPPKFTYTDKEGNKTKVRYVRDQNTIFADKQVDSGDGVVLEQIILNEKNVIKDPLLRDYLLLYPAINKRYELIDPAGQAQKEMDRLSKFDTVWDQVRQLSLESTKALNLLLTDTKLSSMANSTMPELRLSIRNVALKDPDKVAEALADPKLETLYLYHMGIALGVIKYAPKREAVLWADSQKDLCKVPVNKDPAMWVARQLLTDDYLQSKELLETKIND